MVLFYKKPISCLIFVVAVVDRDNMDDPLEDKATLLPQLDQVLRKFVFLTVLRFLTLSLALYRVKQSVL